MRFKNRADAGKLLGQALAKYQSADVVIFALPRGGVVLGAEVANRLKAPLDLVIPRKIGHQFNPEYAIGAVTESGELVCNEAERAAADPIWFAMAVQKEIAEAKRRRQAYLERKPATRLNGKTAIVVDDGIATGLTMLAAIRDLKKRQPKKIVVAVPVVPADTAETLRQEGVELVVLDIPVMYAGAVGVYYDEFAQVEDEYVINLLDQSSKE